jgi:DNA polymerase elongation subunit (family B)
MKGLLSYFRDTRILYKNLAGEFAESDPKKSKSYDRKQLPIKIFINSMFGALSAPQVFQWGDMDKGEQITCTGRQYLRQMIKFFTKRGYKILVLDTDGCNFSLPDGVENKKYIGNGLNWKVKKDKEYLGYDADVAEFNDTFMKNTMALDCDGTWVSCINLSRKNYATLDNKGKVKLTGNTIKSKKLPLYIEDFLDNGIKLLLEGKGHEFVEYYYEYLQKIYDKQIALSKIAQRAKVKLSIEDYIERSKKTTKSGGAMSRMAHMELAIKHGMNVNLGDVIYYVNNGLKASHGDVQKKGDEIILNAYLLENKAIEENPNITGDYNVSRAIATFNKRIEPLLIVFGDEIRDNLLVDSPEKRGLFTKSQCELINGKPFEEGDQDTIEELLTISEMENKFWNKVDIDPNYIYELAEPGWEEKILA